jgi:hypothetical protein
MAKFSRIPFLFYFLVYIFVLSLPEICFSQLSTAENGIMFQVQEFLEYPEALQQWNNWTNFCYLPPSTSLTIVCSNNHVTEITIVGNKSSSSSQKTLSSKFSIDSFFTDLTKLSNLKKLSLVSLGLWGSLPAKISRFSSLEVLNISSNSIYGEIPSSISTLSNLKALILNDNLFNGSVPDLKGLKVLQELNLGNNHLQSRFPSLSDNLVSIILKNNSLLSEIPPALSRFNQLETLDISSNRFVGPIPSLLFNLPSIQFLNLAKNQLSGTLSASITCNAKLGFVDISNNLLIGTLPSCMGSNAANRRVISVWNCLMNTSSKYQHVYRFCHKEALAVKPPSKKENKQQSTVKLGFVLAIVGGIVGIAVLLGALIFVIYKKREKIQAIKEYKCDSFVFEKNSVLGSPIIDGRGQNRPNTMRRMATFGLPAYHNFTLEEMEEATNNFDPSNLVQEGSQGQLYKGWLRDGSTVLVKCLKVKQKHSVQTLQQNVEVISKLRHRHLVSVLGHCIVTYTDHPNTASTVFIVLEYIANGSLRDHLTDWRRREVLKWPQRMGIAMGIARGIQYLHNGVAPGIFGNDLKIQNILLDDTLTPRISSYNISLPSKAGSESPLHGQDTPPRLGRSENAEKDDIYQLGVILLEVITGRAVNTDSELEDLKQQVEMGLAESPAKLKEATDPSIRGTFAYDSLKTTAQITISCLCREASARPSIDDVLWHMQYSSQVQEGWGTSSGNLSGRIA